MNARLLPCLTLAASLAGCALFLVDVPCNGDRNCPDHLTCVAGTCASGAAGEGEGEGGEGEGAAGEGEGEEAACTHAPPGAANLNTDALLAPLSACTTLTGDFTIGGPGVTSLAPLAQVTEDKGTLTLNDLHVADVTPLAALANVADNLILSHGGVDGVPAALTSLTNVGGDLVIQETTIATLDGFPALATIGGKLTFAKNNALAALASTAFPVLTDIDGTVRLDHNPQLPPCAVQRLVDLSAGLDDAGGNGTATCP